MINYLSPELEDKLREIPAQTLAYVGDAVFELMVSTYLCTDGVRSAEKLHKRTVDFVSAKAQATAIEKLLPVLNEDEKELYKRGRNSHTGQVPKSSTYEQYHCATGMETLFGYLYLSGNTKRLNELFEILINERISF